MERRTVQACVRLHHPDRALDVGDLEEDAADVRVALSVPADRRVTAGVGGVASHEERLVERRRLAAPRHAVVARPVVAAVVEPDQRVVLHREQAVDVVRVRLDRLFRLPAEGAVLVDPDVVRRPLAALERVRAALAAGGGDPVTEGVVVAVRGRRARLGGDGRHDCAGHPGQLARSSRTGLDVDLVREDVVGWRASARCRVGTVGQQGDRSGERSQSHERREPYRSRHSLPFPLGGELPASILTLSAGCCKSPVILRQ